MEQYEVGQILYMTSSKSFKIIPIQVVEEVIRTTIAGKEKTYMICFPDKAKTVTDIKKIKTSIFKTVGAVEDYLIDNTKKAIKELVIEADVIKNEAFGATKAPENNIIKKPMQQDASDDIIKVDLGNGQIGKISKKQIPLL